MEILEPLLYAASVEQMAATFGRLFPTFRDYYLSTLLILLGSLKEDPRRLASLTILSFGESERLLRTQGPRWIGQEATLNALHGLATITRIVKVQFGANTLGAEPLANAIVAYTMAFSCILSALNAMSNGSASPVRLENTALLSNWSRSYATAAFHRAKFLGLLKITPPLSSVRPAFRGGSGTRGFGSRQLCRDASRRRWAVNPARRGEVWWLDLGTHADNHEQAGRRPGIVLQTN
jgi:hypothetical protein